MPAQHVDAEIGGYQVGCRDANHTPVAVGWDQGLWGWGTTDQGWVGPESGVHLPGGAAPDTKNMTAAPVARAYPPGTYIPQTKVYNVMSTAGIMSDIECLSRVK